MVPIRRVVGGHSRNLFSPPGNVCACVCMCVCVCVTSFKYLGSVITDEGSKPELLCRIAPVSYTHLTLPTSDLV